MTDRLLRTATRTHSFSESVIREMTRVAREHDAINLAQGFPDFPAPQLLKDAACAAIQGDVNQYAITWGTANLRNALSEKYAAMYGLEFDPEREITVTFSGKPLKQINELEVVDGLIYANIWHSGFIVAIDPTDGVVRRVIDLRPLAEAVPVQSYEAVLNGIAHDPQNGRWLVTGKLWPSLFEVRFVPREAEVADSASETAGR